MSMISELLKTPAEARQEDIIKLQQVGSRTSANLRAAPQGQYSNLPGIFSNYAAGIADQQSTAADGLFRGITQAGGQLARAAGGAGLMDQEKAAQLQQGLQNASMSGNERQAMQNQEIMAGVQGASDPVAAYSGAAKKAFAAGNQKLGMALEQKAAELQAAQTASDRQGRALDMQETKAAQDTQLFDQGQRIQEVLGGVTVDQDPVKYFRSMATALSKEGLGTEAAKMAKTAADLRKNPAAIPDRYIKAGDNKIFDTFTQEFLASEEGEEDVPKGFADKSEYSYYIDVINENSAANSSASKIGDLLNAFQGVDLASGFTADAKKKIADSLGVRDYNSAIRTWTDGIRTMEAFKALPPGPATEREVAGAFATVPPDNDTAANTMAWLRRAERSAMIVAEFSKQRGKFMEDNGSIRGLVTANKGLFESSVNIVNARTADINSAKSIEDIEKELDILMGNS